MVQYGLVELREVETVTLLPLHLLAELVERGAADEVRRELRAALLRPP